jgi:hypothetical protein
MNVEREVATEMEMADDELAEGEAEEGERAEGGVEPETIVMEPSDVLVQTEVETGVETEVGMEVDTEMATAEQVLISPTLPQTVPDVNADCPICLEALGDHGGMVAELQCGHALCHACLTEAQSARYKCCPLCRLRLPQTTEDHRPSARERRERFKLAKSNARQAFTTMLYPAVREQHHYTDINEMLALSNLKGLKVCGDGNCGYYSCLASCDVRALDHPRSSRGPTGRDYTKQTKLRIECVGWLLQTAQLPFCTLEAGFLGQHETVTINGASVMRLCNPFLSTHYTWSWAEEVVPKMQRHLANYGSQELVVILWNGETDRSGHFDATCKL